MLTLHIHLLGDLRLVYDDSPVTTVAQARLQALLAYLLLHRGVPQPRQRLAFLFWPDTAEPQAHTNLRQLLHHLRHSLPAADQFLQVETKTVQWRLDAAYTLDVAEFEHDLAQAAAAAKVGRFASERTALESAVQHFGGDLLPGCYDDWILPERERLRQAYFGALERLVLLAEDQRDYGSAIGHAECLLRHDPLHEATYRRLMRLHALHGDRAGALRVYHTCVTVLERELGVEPTADTQEAYRRLLNMEAPAVLRARPPAVSAARPALVGRHVEWMMLRSAWRRAAAGHAAFVLISGEAGIGKTRLAEEFLEWASQQGITTARTRSYAAEGQLAYAPVAELLRADPFRTRLSRLEDVWLTELARLLPELLVEHPDLPNPQPITDGWQRKRLFEGLARSVLGDKGPLLLLLDDLQWCDQDTLEWLHYLLHFDAEAKLLITGAVRFEEVDQAHPLTPLALDLRNREQLTEIELGSLDAGDTTTLAEQVAGRKLDAGQASRLYHYTEGNPLFVVETIRAEVSGGEANRALVLPNPPPSQRPPFSTEMPAKVQALIQARLHRLSPSARELADLAATIGHAFTFDVLAQASESDEGTLVRALDELWRRRIVREQGNNAYDFSHDRIREVAYAGLSSARRRQFHRRVAGALEQLRPGQIDSIAIALAYHFREAGERVQARRYFARAGDAACKVYAIQEAADAYTEALALTPGESPERFNLLAARAKLFDIVAQRDPQRADIDAMLALAEIRNDDMLRCDALIALADFYLATQHIRAPEPAERAVVIARSLGDPVREGHALRRLGEIATFVQFDFLRGRTMLEQAVTRFRDAGLTGETATCLHILSITLERLGELSAAEQAAQEAIALCRATSDRRQEAAGLRRLGVIYFSQGRLAESLSVAQAALALHRGLGDREGEGYTLNILGYDLAYLARPDESEACLRQALEIGEAIDSTIMVDQAISHLRRFHFERRGDYEAELAFLETLLAKAQLASNRFLVASINWYKAGVRGDLGQFGTAIELIRGALATGQLDGPVDQSQCLADLARWQAERGEYVQAKQMLQDALGRWEHTHYWVLLNLAHVAWLEGRQIDDRAANLALLRDGIDSVQRVIEICTTKQRESIRAIAFMSAAWLYMTLDEADKALAYSTEAVRLADIDPSPLWPEKILLAHARALRAACREAEADDYLRRAYERVMLVAGKIQDETLRRSWLENVRDNREIVAEWTARSSHP